MTRGTNLKKKRAEKLLLTIWRKFDTTRLKYNTAVSTLQEAYRKADNGFSFQRSHGFEFPKDEFLSDPSYFSRVYKEAFKGVQNEKLVKRLEEEKDELKLKKDKLETDAWNMEEKNQELSLEIQRLTDEKREKVRELESKLSDAKSAQVYTAVFSILGTLASVFSLKWLFGNRNNSKTSSSSFMSRIGLQV